MRKLLVLMLVIAMASMANAALHISVNGDPNPPDWFYRLVSSETASLDIWTDADIPTFGGEYWALVTNTTRATISGGVSIYPDCLIWDGAANAGIPGLPPGADGVWGVITLDTVPSIPAASVIYDLIVMHGTGGAYGPVVELYRTDFQTSILVDSVVFRSPIPEPMTLALLGLGGLLLRRRK